jgi:hypothetical protein
MQKISNIFKPALIAVFVMLVAVQAGQFHPVAAQGATLQLQSAIEAKRIIDQVPRARIEKVRTVAFRADMLKAYDAIKAIADNRSTAREAGLLANLKRLTIKLNEDTHTAGSMWNTNECDRRLQNCGELGGDPKLCQLGDEMCIFMAITTNWFPPL